MRDTAKQTLKLAIAGEIEIGAIENGQSVRIPVPKTRWLTTPAAFALSCIGGSVHLTGRDRSSRHLAVAGVSSWPTAHS